VALPLLLGVALTGLLVGAWPAFVLSGFAPVQVLKGWMQTAGNAAPVRFILVTAQFAILTVLIIAAGVVWQQQDYAAHEAIRFDTAQLLMVEGDLPRAFPGEVARLPGVRAARSTGAEFAEDMVMMSISRQGKDVLLRPVRTERGIFPFYGVAPIAGSLQLNSVTGEDNAVQGVVINRSAVARLGFASPQAALGRTVWDDKPWAQLPIIAVVPDFWLHRVDAPIEPAVFAGFVEGIRNTDGRRLLHVRLDGRQIPETLAAIDRLWRATGGKGPIKRYFFDAHLEERYLDLQRQAQMFGFFAAIAIFLACLGLVGIAISTAERRTKEIGVRKAAGAGSGQIVALLLWQFSRPVLWANIVAWPAAFWLMQRWLSGFSMHIELGPGIFLAASALSLVVAVLTVMGQAVIVARQKPVVALRYE
jgi:putative ABC transport system permease protein